MQLLNVRFAWAQDYYSTSGHIHLQTNGTSVVPDASA